MSVIEGDYWQGKTARFKQSTSGEVGGGSWAGGT
jgi:hypothetical protein